MLLKENGLFLADDRVIPLLPKLLGKIFFNAKKQPIPVCLRRKDLKGELERAVSCTYFHQNQGTCSSVKIGVMGQHSSAQLLQNLSTALPHVVKNIRENWDNIQSIHIKTSSSASLPIWSCRLDEEEGGRWDGLTRVPIPDDADEETKGKKRTLVSREESGKKRQKSDPAPTKRSTTIPHPSISHQPPTQPARPAAADFFDSDDAGDCFSLSNAPASETPAPQRREKSKQPQSSKDSVPIQAKSKGKEPSKTKTILKSSKSVVGPTPTRKPGKEKHVKFATELSDSKTKRDKALGLAGKRVRSGGGKSASAKDGVLGKKVAVK